MQILIDETDRTITITNGVTEAKDLHGIERWKKKYKHYRLHSTQDSSVQNYSNVEHIGEELHDVPKAIGFKYNQKEK